MSEKIVKIKTLGKYNGHNITNNKAVNLTLIFAYDELPNYIQLIQLLNENVDIAAKIGDDKAMRLGSFMIKEIKVDHDGQGIIKFNSLMDAVEADSLNHLVGETFQVMFKAEVELEEDEEDE